MGVVSSQETTMRGNRKGPPPHLVVAHCEDAPVHCGVQGLDAAIQHLGKPGHILHLRRRRAQSSSEAEETHMIWRLHAANLCGLQRFVHDLVTAAEKSDCAPFACGLGGALLLASVHRSPS